MLSENHMKYGASITLATVWLAISSACNPVHTVSYQRDVYPILKKNCFGCHSSPAGEGYLAVGLDLESYDGLMRGTIYNSVVVPGNSQYSILSMLVEGRADAAMKMPHNADEPLTSRDIEILQRWINQGANNN